MKVLHVVAGVTPVSTFDEHLQIESQRTSVAFATAIAINKPTI
jgi:hypothetical protein